MAPPRGRVRSGRYGDPYAIETPTGVRGTIADAVGVYADPSVGGFMRSVVRCHPAMKAG
jgi:hypothetical protein